MTREEFERLERIYQRFPQFLSGPEKELLMAERQRLLSLQKQADQYSTTPWKMMNQLVSGFISGVTGLGSYADEPRNTWEALAETTGHLGGFVGIVWPGKTVGSGISRAAGALGKAFASKGYQRAAAPLYGLERVAEGFRSVPLQITDFLAKTGPVRQAANVSAQLLKGRPIWQQALASSSHLGTAMFISQLHEGVDEAFRSGVFGALTGGLIDAGVGNLPMLAGKTSVSRMLRASAGAITNTVTPALMGQNPFDIPVEMLVYDALLGGYFGWKSMDARTWQATKYFYEKGRGNVLGIETDPEYLTLDPEVRKQVREKRDEFVEENISVPTAFTLMGKAIAPDIDALPKVLPNETVRIEGRGPELHRVTEVTDSYVQLADGTKVDPAYVTPTRRLTPEMAYMALHRDIGLYHHDYEGFARSKENYLSDFIRRVTVDEQGKPALPRMTAEEYYSHVQNVRDNLLSIRDRKLANPQEVDDIAEIKRYMTDALEERGLRLKTQPITAKEWAPLMDWYTEVYYARPTERMHYNLKTGRLGVDTAWPEGGVVRDSAMKDRQYMTVPPLYAKVSGLKWGVIDNVVNESKGRVVTTDYNTAGLGRAHWGNIMKDLWSRNMGLVGAPGDKTIMYTSELLPKERLQQVWKEMVAADPMKGTSSSIDSIVARSAQMLKADPQMIRDNMANNAALWKMQNKGLSLSTVLAPQGRRIRDVMDFNKRLQIFTEKWTPIHPGTLEEKYRKLRYVYASDPGKEYDGSIFVLPEYLDAYTAGIGETPGRVGALKPFMYEATNEGVQGWKPALFPMSEGLAKQMRAKGISAIVYDTAAKTTGSRVVHDMSVDEMGNTVFAREGVPVDEQRILSEMGDLRREQAANMLAEVKNAYIEKLGGGLVKPGEGEYYQDYQQATGKFYGGGGVSTFPEWFKNKGFSKAKMVSALEDYLRGAAHTRTKEARFVKEHVEQMLRQGGEIGGGDVPPAFQEPNQRFLDLEKQLLQGAGKLIGEPIAYETDVENLFFSRDIMDDAYRKMKRGVRFFKQMKDGMDDPAAVSAVVKMARESYEGDPKANDIYLNYRRMRANDPQGAADYLRAHADQFDYMNKLDTIKLADEDPVFLSELLRWRLRDPDEPMEDVDYDITAEKFLDYEMPYHDVNRLLAAGMYDNGIMSQKYANDQVHHILRRHFIDGLSRPRLKHSISARLAPIDPVYRQQLRAQGYTLGDDVFYFGREEKNLPVMGIDAEGNAKEMPLGELWAQFEPVAEQIRKGAKLTPLQKKIKTTFEDALEFVLARNPIAAASEMRVQRFDGFLDLPGGNVYVSKKTMDELGTADYDIDSVGAFQGLPKEYRKWLKSKKDDPQKIKAFFGGYDPAEQFFVDRSPTDAISTNPLAMFDPFNLIEANRATSIGRGQALPRNAAFKRRLLMLTEHMKSLPDVQKTPNLRGLGEFLFEVPSTEADYYMLHGLSGGALRAAADASGGGETGRRLPMTWREMRKYMIRGAFPALRVNGHTIYDRTTNVPVEDPQVEGFKRLAPLDRINEAMMDVVVGERIYPYDKNGEPLFRWGDHGLSGNQSGWGKFYNENGQKIDHVIIAGKRFTADEVHKYFSKARAIDSLAPMSRLMDLQAKWYRSAEGRPYTFDEISRASKNFADLGIGTHPLTEIATMAAPLRWSKTLLSQLDPSVEGKQYFQWWDRYLLEENPEIASFLPERPTTPYGGIDTHIRAIGSNWGNLRTESQRQGFSQPESDQAFMEFMDKTKQAYKNWKDQPLERYLGWLAGQIPDPVTNNRRPRSQGIFDVRFNPMKLNIPRTVTERTRFLNHYVDFINDIISERLATLASVRSMIELQHEMDIAPTELRSAITKKYQLPKASGGLTEGGISLMDAAVQIKRLWAAERRRPAVEGQATAMEDMVQLVRDGRWIADRIAEEYGVSPIKMNEFYETLLLSPIRGNVGRSISSSEQRLGLRFVTDRTLQRFARAFNEAFTIIKDSATSPKIEQFFTMVKKDTEVDNRRVYERIIFPRELVPQSRWTPEVTKLYNKAQEYLSDPNFPMDFAKQDPQKFLYGLMDVVGVAQPGDLTVDHLRGMVNFLREMRHGPTFLNWLTGQGGIQFGRMLGVKFPDTLDREQMGQELIMHHRAVMDAEKKGFNPWARVYKQVDPVTKQVVDVYRDYVEFTSTLGRLKAVSNNIAQAQNMETRWAENYVKKLDSMLSVTGGNADDGMKLFTWAVLGREGRAFVGEKPDRKYWDNLDEVKYRRSKHQHMASEMKWREANSKLLDKEYVYQDAGKSVTVKGSELVKRFQDTLEEMLDKNDRIFLTEEWMQKHIPIDFERFRRTGTFDISALLTATHGFEEVLRERIPFPHEYAALATYMTEVDMTAKYTPISGPKSLEELYNWQAPFLRPYREIAQEAGLVGKTPTEWQAWMRREFAEARRDGRDPHELAFVIHRYTNPKIEERDWRTLLVPQSELLAKDMSLLSADVEYMQGRLMPQDYTTRYLLSTKPFRLKERIPGYFPHRLHEPKALLDWITQARAEIAGNGRSEQENYDSLVTLDRIYNNMRGFDSQFPHEQDINETISDNLSTGKNYLLNLDEFHWKQAKSMKGRSADIPGYEISPRALLDYFAELNANKYRTLQAMLGFRIMREHVERMKPIEDAGKLPAGTTAAMQHYYRMYLRQAMDLPSIFTTEELTDPVLKIKQTPYYWFSDHAALVQGTRAHKWFIKMMGADSVNEGEKRIWGLDSPEKVAAFKAEKIKQLTTLSDGVKTGNLTEQDKHNIAVATKYLRRFAQFEARYELMTLLAHIKSAVANTLGGNLNIAVMHGFKTRYDAGQLRTWQRINNQWQSMNDVYKWVEDLGVLHDVVLQDAQIRRSFSKPNERAFLEDFLRYTKKDPEMTDQTLGELAKKHGLDERFINTAGSFMRVTERRNRRMAFLTGYLAGRKHLEPLSNYDVNMPYLINLGRKTIEMSQFMYDNVNRPLFATTNLGHIYSRFKLWTWSSTRFQREIFNDAAKQGFRPGSPEFERLQRLVTVNMFLIGLASLFPYTIFDSTLPGPLATMQNLSDWAFGDEQARDRAFFGQGNIIFKGPLAPVNEFLPPVTRLPAAVKDAFEWIFDSEKDLLASYILWTTIPFGRMTRDVFRTLRDPQMLPDFMLGVPLMRFQRTAQAERAKKEKK